MILRMTKTFWSVSPWHNLAYNERKVREFLMSILEDEENSVLLCHDQGVIAGSLVPIAFSDTYIANELFWFAHAEGLPLLRAFEQWAQIMGVDNILLSSLVYGTEKDDTLKKLYNRKGYDPVEVHYIKTLSNKGVS